MGTLSRIIMTIVWVTLLIYVSGIAFTFFGIPPSQYFPYLMWIMGLAVLASFLPDTITSVF